MPDSADFADALYRWILDQEQAERDRLAGDPPIDPDQQRSDREAHEHFERPDNAPNSTRE